LYGNAGADPQLFLLGFLLFLLGVAGGFWLGRRRRPPPRLPQVRPRARAKRPLDVLRDLLEEDPAAADAFVDALAGDRDPAEAQLALGTRLRLRGHWDAATRVHRQLLARPELATARVREAELELARDHRAAGRLDRARRLLERLLSERGADRDAVRRELLELELDAGDPGTAAALAARLVESGDDGARAALAHCRCALAEAARERGATAEARSQVAAALEADPDCARALLLQADLAAARGRYREAASALRSLGERAPRFLPLALPSLAAVQAQLGRTQEEERLLRRWHEQLPSASVLERLAELREARDGPGAQRAALLSDLEGHPNLRVFRRLLALGDEGAGAAPVLDAAAARLLAAAPPWGCEVCGATPAEHEWRCAACGSWESVAPSRGLLGE
jgi:lipopolysaccharide biosynthesis regulator YciM